jgi:hypothetical protein
MIKLIITITFTLFCTARLFAEYYYVDVANGSDTNAGTSPSNAWKTVRKVNEFAFKPGDVIHFRAGQVWRESVKCQSGSEIKPLIYTRYGEGAKPLFLGSIDISLEYFWVDNGSNIWSTAPDFFSTGMSPNYLDVGNIILTAKGETGKKAAWKRWNLEELTSQGDFFHDTRNDLLFFYSDRNPALVYSVMEAAMKRNIFDISNSEYLVIDGLAAAYSGAHGAYGYQTKNIIIRNCDFLWIGGSFLFYQNERPVRYGNGIEFWNDAQDNLVENNYFEQIYDVAMTNQGPEACLVKNIIWRNNKIYRCEQAFEIWLSNPESRMRNVVFESNECIDSGFGWSHEQRPNPTGTHILAYSVASKEFDIYYRNNVFNNAADAIIWYYNTRLPEAHLDNNTYIQKGEDCDKLPLFRLGNSHIPWKEYRRITGHDKDSSFRCE